MSTDDQDWPSIDQAANRWIDEQIRPGALDRILVGALKHIEVETQRLDRLRWGWLVTRAQIPIIRQRLVAASLIVMALGAMVAIASGKSWPRDVFVLVAPLAAAGAAAALFRDNLGELSFTLRASARLILLARLVVVLGIDLAATLLVSVAVAGRTHEALTTLVAAWLGPMLLLAATSLLVSTVTTATTGITVALGLWFVRVIVGLHTTGAFVSPALAAHVEAAWTTSSAMLAATVAMLVAAVVVAPRQSVTRA